MPQSTLQEVLRTTDSMGGSRALAPRTAGLSDGMFRPRSSPLQNSGMERAGRRCRQWIRPLAMIPSLGLPAHLPPCALLWEGTVQARIFHLRRNGMELPGPRSLLQPLAQATTSCTGSRAQVQQTAGLQVIRQTPQDSPRLSWNSGMALHLLLQVHLTRPPRKRMSSSARTAGPMHRALLLGEAQARRGP